MKKLILIFTIILTLAAISLTAQGRLYQNYFIYGAYIGLNYNIHNSDFSELPGIPNCCPNFNSGTGYGINGGGILGYAFTDRINGNVNLGVVNLSSELLTEQMVPFIYDDIELDARIEHTIDTKLIGITLGAGIEYKFTEYLYGLLRLNLLRFATYEFTQQEKLVSPQGVSFENGQRVRNYIKGELSNVSSVVASLSFGAKYFLKINNKFFVCPEINYTFGLSNIMKNTDWKISSSMVILNLIFVPDRELSTPIEPAR
jgi:hypothetical protein